MRQNRYYVGWICSTESTQVTGNFQKFAWNSTLSECRAMLPPGRWTESHKCFYKHDGKHVGGTWQFKDGTGRTFTFQITKIA
jgi:hypothetical protein